MNIKSLRKSPHIRKSLRMPLRMSNRSPNLRYNRMSNRSPNLRYNRISNRSPNLRYNRISNRSPNRRPLIKKKVGGTCYNTSSPNCNQMYGYTPLILDGTAPSSINTLNTMAPQPYSFT